MTEDRRHQPIVHVRSRQLRADTGPTSGMTRREAPAGLPGIHVNLAAAVPPDVQAAQADAGPASVRPVRPEAVGYDEAGLVRL
jgi:hypothetical protein